MYYSSLTGNTYDISGKLIFDIQENKAETYSVGIGKVVWDIEYQNFDYDVNTGLISKGIAILRREHVRSFIVIKEDHIEQDINAKATILMIKNKYANSELHPDQVLKNKEQATELIGRLQQSRKNNR
jgi:hypothetical protein